jgi:hypothetical protein
MRQTIIAVSVLALATAAVATPIGPGFDFLKAQPSSIWDFSTNPIPAGFFGDGSDLFDQATVPVTMTKVWRGRPAEFLDPAVPVAVETEMVAMSLHSVEPIEVTYGGGSPRFFDVFITLDDRSGPSVGVYELTHNPPGDPDGGWLMDSFFDVFFDIHFMPVIGGAPLHLYRSQRLALADPVPWSHAGSPLYNHGDSGGFFLGLDPSDLLPPDGPMPQTIIYEGSEFTWVVRLAAVPEPATLTFLALGVLGIRRRRRR